MVAGYGILQPRVGISTQSASRSRLASLYSGETGFDIYTRAISDVYQDLYGEGIFAGKGIYEVDTVHRVLDRRFPRNALLSHDLIEGAYARAGLASDIEIIEDYPSHYSAYNRRKHRWLRGDWQITGWLLSSASPTSRDARFQIPFPWFRNGRFWTTCGAAWWSPQLSCCWCSAGWCCRIRSIGRWQPWPSCFCSGLVPVPVQPGAGGGRAQIASRSRTPIRAHYGERQHVFHAVIPAAPDAAFARCRGANPGPAAGHAAPLLEWETAAETELSTRKRTPVDIYLDWMPALALALGVLVLFAGRRAFFAALPILLLWGCSKWISMWLNLPSRAMRKETSDKDELFLSGTALRTWRYFAEFSTEEHNWLIPDNVQEEPAAVAGRMSPTNLGFLLNARQVACEFGFLTVPEFAEQTLRTLATMAKLPRSRGHLLNWYDTRTLEPLRPRFISSVDSGNLVASLWTLQQGCLDLLQRPLLEKQLAEGLADHLRILVDRHAFPHKRFRNFLEQVRKRSWLQRLLAPSEEGLLETDLETEGPQA